MRLAVLFSFAWTISSVVSVSQTPISIPPQLSTPPNVETWDFGAEPSPNSTDHLVFDTVNSLLQHWTNTRYRNGHTIAVGSIPVGTLLYHGADEEIIPPVPEWVAVDPEHSHFFCRLMQDEEGCWHLTFVTTRPLNVVYFDGTSGAKFPGGPVDTQDLLVWGETKAEWVYEERKRINALCELGRPYGIDAFVRTQMDVEIMVCDFRNGLELVSSSHFTRIADGRPDPLRKPKIPSSEAQPRSTTPAVSNVTFLYSLSYRVIESGAWHDRYPGDPRFHLDYSKVLSLYDTHLFPSLVPKRFGKERFFHRAGDMSAHEASTIKPRLESILRQGPGSGFDWRALFKIIHTRYVDRLELLEYMLRNITDTRDTTPSSLKAEKIMRQIQSMLVVYITTSTTPGSLPSPEPTPSHLRNAIRTHDWAVPIWKQCARTHTAFFHSPSFRSRLTYSESLLLRSVEGVNKEICRLLSLIWAEGAESGVDPEAWTTKRKRPASTPGSEAHLTSLFPVWHARVRNLMTWLDWSDWAKCSPTCGFEEFCYMTTWPYFANSTPEHLPNYPTEDGTRPRARCLRRVEPFEF